LVPGYSVLRYIVHRAGLRTTSLKICARSGFSLGAPVAVDSSTIPRTSAGACAAAAIAEPLAKEWPIITAGPPRWRISARTSAPMLVWVWEAQRVLDWPCPRMSMVAIR
jgi:hypothetical protein